jgi:hypothetical protein
MSTSTARTVDDLVTEVTDAPTPRQARAIMASVRSRNALEAMADQLYIEYVGVGSDTLRAAIVAEARA